MSAFLSTLLKALFGAFFKAFFGHIEEQKENQAFKDLGAAEENARHEKAAQKTGAAMQEIADKPPTEDEIDKRLDGGTA